jgi:EmrB/QacA subfamily drug resistance transporter
MQAMEVTEMDYDRKWYVMAAVGMGIFLATIDASIVNVALPTLVRELATDFATVQWVVLAYLLTLTTLMLGVGRLADMKGKKPIYALGFVIFTLGSVLAGFSASVQALIAFRVLQAVGAAMILALGSALVTEAFPPSERGMALGVSGSVVSIGIVLGPTLGGLLIEALSWHWIFFVNLPVGIVGTVMVLRFVPAIQPAGEQRFDLWGALTLFLSLISMLLGLTWGQQIGFGQARILALFAASAILMGLFVLIESRTRQPMIDLQLFRNALFSLGLVTGFLTFISIAGSIFLMPFYLENVLGYDPRQVGLLLAIVPIALGVTAPISGSLSDRFGTRPITVAGLAALALGYYALSSLDTTTSAAGYVLRFLPIGIGMGVFQSPNNSAIMGAAPRGRLGIVSGMLAITRTLGQTTGIAFLGAFWASSTFRAAGRVFAAGATQAPAAAQVAGLQDTFLAVDGLILLALALAVWGLVRARQRSPLPLSGETLPPA